MTDSNPITTETRPPVVVEWAISWAHQGAKDSDTFEIPRDEWDAMTPAQRYQRCQEEVDGIAENELAWGWHIADEADYAAAQEQA